MSDQNNIYEDLLDEDDPDDDGNDSAWECLSCGHSQLLRPAWGGQCPRCGTLMEEYHF